MPPRLSNHVTTAQYISPDEDNDLRELGVRDQSGWEPIKIPPSPSLSLSTTTSELEVEQGEALLRVKRVRLKEEEIDDLIPSTEVVPSDESDKPAPKKRKRSSTGAKRKGTSKKKSGTRTYSDEVPV